MLAINRLRIASTSCTMELTSNVLIDKRISSQGLAIFCRHLLFKPIWQCFKYKTHCKSLQIFPPKIKHWTRKASKKFLGCENDINRFPCCFKSVITKLK